MPPPELFARWSSATPAGPVRQASTRATPLRQPPFHAPVYGLTRTAPRPSIPMEGGTTFHFRNTAIAEVLAEATVAAGGQDLRVSGGISTARDFLLARLVDHLHVMIAPIVLGKGTRLWDGLGGLELTHTVTTEVAESGTIHVNFTR